MPELNPQANQSSPTPPLLPPPPPTQPTSAPQTPQPQNPAQATPSQNPQSDDATPVSQTGPSLHARIFDKILKGMSGGDIKVVNPDGSISTQPQSRASMGKSIVAAALTGLMTPTHYRETPYGPTIDYSAGAADAAQRGRAVFAAPQQQAQKLSDEQQTRKLMTIQNNARLVQTMAASAHMKHEMLTDLTSNAKDFLKPFEDYDSLRTDDPSTPKAFLNKDQSADEVLSSGHKLTDSNVVLDGGTRRKLNPATNTWDEEPTYAVLNPDLKDVQLPESVTKKLAEINGQYQDIHAVTGGTLRLPINAYVSAMHDYQTVTQGEHILNTLNKEINGDDAQEINLSPIVRGDRQNMLRALQQMEASPAGGNSPSQRPDNVLDTILKTPNGDKLLGLLGTTPEEADKFIQDKNNERTRLNKLAQEGGIGDKSPMDPTQVADIPNLGKKLGLTPAQIEVAVGKKNTNGMTVAEYRQAVDKMQSQSNTNAQVALAKNKEAGDPKDVDTLSNQLLQPNNLTAMRDLASRGTQREAIMAEAIRKAAIRGIPFDPGLINERLDFLKDYMKPTGKDSMNRRSLNNLTQHAGNLSELNHGVESQAANTALNAIESQFGNEAYQKFLTETAVLKDEVSNYFAGGFAPNKDQKATWDKILADNATPNQIESFVKTIIPEAAVRLDSTGQTFKEVMGYDDPNLVTPATKAAAEKLGLGQAFSKFKSGGQLSQTLPPTQPAGTVGTARGSDGKTYYVDANKKPLGLVGQ